MAWEPKTKTKREIGNKERGNKTGKLKKLKNDHQIIKIEFSRDIFFADMCVMTGAGVSVMGAWLM